MTGMIARSVSFSAVSCDPSFVKTIVIRDVSWSSIGSIREQVHTETRSKQSDVKIGHQFLGFGIEHAALGGQIPR